MEKKYFNIEKGFFLYTDDGWKSFKKSNDRNLLSEYVVEKDEARKYEKRLENHYGKSIANLIIDEFKNIEKRYYDIKKSKLYSSAGYGLHFEIFSISLKYQVSYEKVISDYLICGDRDGGVDAIYYNDKEVHIYQIKIGNLEDDTAIERMMLNIDEYATKGKIEDKDASNLNYFLGQHYERDLKGKDFYYFTISENSNKKENYTSSYFYNLFISRELERRRISFKHEIEILKNENKESVSYCPDNLHKEIFVFANAKSLVETLSKHIEDKNNIDYLFVDNVRGRLKKNVTLINTIKNEPKMFCFYNNGISILGKFQLQRQFPKIIVNDPLIINGQQTMISLIAANNDSIDISNVFVPVFIKEVATKDELRNIAKYNNSQAKISQLDLLSIDSNLRKIQSELLDSVLDTIKSDGKPFYLNIVRNGKNKQKERVQLLFEKERVINIGDFIKLYSVIQKPSNLGLWKNSIDKCIKKNYKEGFPYVNKELSLKICSCIYDSHRIINGKNEYRIADLTIQYLLYCGYSDGEITSIIDSINQDSDKMGENKANAFRQSDSFTKLLCKINELGLPYKLDIVSN